MSCGTRCLSPGTPIRTPDGDTPVASLKPGDLVLSIHHGRVAVVPIERTTRVPANGHHVVEVRLATGQLLEISPGHPTADGRRFADLQPGQDLGGIAITSLRTIPYRHPYTHDILPASSTGIYFAGGALVRSTLGPSMSLDAHAER